MRLVSTRTFWSLSIFRTAWSRLYLLIWVLIVILIVNIFKLWLTRFWYQCGTLCPLRSSIVKIFDNQWLIISTFSCIQWIGQGQGWSTSMDCLLIKTLAIILKCRKWRSQVSLRSMKIDLRLVNVSIKFGDKLLLIRWDLLKMHKICN